VLRLLPVFVALLLAPLALAGHFLDAAKFDLRAVLPDPPADNSVPTRAELEAILWMQQARTPEQAAVAKKFETDTVWQYSDILGAWFTEKNLPATASLMLKVQQDRKAVSDRAKEVWVRPRPSLQDARIVTVVELPKSGAYPSGHTTQAYVWTGILADIFPEKREALLERARLVGWSRVYGGVHFPSDVIPGKMLGEALVSDFLKTPGVRAAIATAKAEVAAIQK
jgi:acid phosphatase (class A)